MRILKRLDDGLARGEAAIATAVLLSMIVLAATQALLYNLATRLGLDWANDGLTAIDWTDKVLQQGTLWLAFLGASLATHQDSHIAIDALPRILPGRPRLLVKGITSIVAGITSFFLARVMYTAALGAQERPYEWEVLADSGPAHLCDAPLSVVVDAGMSRPDLFCMVRSGLEALGSPAETPVGALQYIVPVMFLVMAVRFVARGVASTVSVSRGDGVGTGSLAERESLPGIGLTAPLEDGGDASEHDSGRVDAAESNTAESNTGELKSSADDRSTRKVDLPDDEGEA